MLIAVLALISGAVYAAGPDASVVSFAPQGTVKQVRQVTARFSEAMVPLGDPRVNAAAFSVDCPAPGTPRWIDSRTWSYDFKNDLPAGLRCTFTLNANLKTLRGAGFAGPARFTFDTGGPSMVETRPWTDSSDIDEEQAFVVILDAQPDPQSILDHAGFGVEGIPQMVGVTIMSGADRDQLLKRFKNFINSGRS